MFTDVKMEDYDLKNDLHKARFFRDCLIGDLVFSKPKNIYDTKRISWSQGLLYEGIICPYIVVKREMAPEIISLEELLCFIMGFPFDEATQLIKMYQEENNLWTEKRDEEFEKIEKIGRGLRQKKREWLENNPFKFSRNVDIKVLIAFKEHFSTEHNIVMALRHLSMIHHSQMPQSNLQSK